MPLGPLADNGGPTLTHALLPGSPALNAGSNEHILSVDDPLLLDQRGQRRVAGGTVDIGAFELNRPPTVSADGTPQVFLEGQSLSLLASGFDPDGDTLTFSWDVNGDGTFGDATGASPTLSWAEL